MRRPFSHLATPGGRNASHRFVLGRDRSLGPRATPVSPAEMADLLER
jgi:hypothetical protein